jgi:hypothetical protein
MVPGAIAVFGVAGLTLGLARNPVLASAAMLTAGLVWVWVLATLNATTQLLSPSWVRGRMMSLYMLSFLGFMPLGSILAGGVADLIGPGPAIASLSGLTIVLAGLVARLPLPVLDEVVTPVVPEDYEAPAHPLEVEGGPVMVLTTWVIADESLAQFLDAMEQMRRVRLRTGAYRWRLYRNVGDPHRMTEVFLLRSWEEHLRQHDRIDIEAAAVIQHARGFDVDGGPITRHLAAIDVRDPAERPDWEALVAVHGEMHRTDGSVPLDVDDAAR